MASPKKLLDQVREGDELTDEAIWYYIKLLETPPTSTEWSDGSQRGFYKFLWAAQQVIEHLDQARQDTERVHTLEGAAAFGVNLDLWAEFYGLTREFGWANDVWLPWIKFEILRQRCSGTPDGIKVLAAAFLTLVNDLHQTYEQVPWASAARVQAMPDAEGLTLPEGVIADLESWPTLGKLAIEFQPPHYVETSEPGYLGVVVPHELLETPEWMIDAMRAAGNDEGAPTNDPQDEAFWFYDSAGDNRDGFDNAIWDGHWLLTELLEVLWEANHAGMKIDVHVDGFRVAENDEGSPSSDPNDESFWFASDLVDGFDAGRLSGAALGDGGVYQNVDLKIYEQPGWHVGRGNRRFVLSPEVEMMAHW